jgi:hypothetical protein
LNGGQQQRNENSDDRDYNQKFDQREASAHLDRAFLGQLRLIWQHDVG